jgi:hypothetical protein
MSSDPALAASAPTDVEAPTSLVPNTTTSSQATNRLSFTVAMPIPRSDSVPVLTPPAETAERSLYLSAPASARTSFTRVDQTRAGTPLVEEPESSAGEGSALGAASSEPAAHHPEVPQASITFLLVSGRRRNMNFEPDTTIGRVKELVWNTWPAGTHASFPSNDVLGLTPSHVPENRLV